MLLESSESIMVLFTTASNLSVTVDSHGRCKCNLSDHHGNESNNISLTPFPNLWTLAHRQRSRCRCQYTLNSGRVVGGCRRRRRPRTARYDIILERWNKSYRAMRAKRGREYMMIHRRYNNIVMVNVCFMPSALLLMGFVPVDMHGTSPPHLATSTSSSSS